MIYMKPYTLETADLHSPSEPASPREGDTVFQAHRSRRSGLWEQSMTARPSRYAKQLMHAAMQVRSRDSGT
jgi:hypothetical protein